MPSFSSLVSAGDALLIVPPFTNLHMPSMGIHLLQACAREEGFDVKILYANFPLAAAIGEPGYHAICHSQQYGRGERFFAPVAYDRSSPHINTQASEWADAVTEAVTQHDFAVVGCTDSFEQTAASVALLNRIKNKRPNVVTIIGGGNCLGEMADGILSLGASIDYIFSGEGESSFPWFLRNVREKRLPEDHIIRGHPHRDIETIPIPDFSDFFDQLAFWSSACAVLRNENSLVPYEASRGCCARKTLRGNQLPDITPPRC